MNLKTTFLLSALLINAIPAYGAAASAAAVAAAAAGNQQQTIAQQIAQIDLEIQRNMLLEHDLLQKLHTVQKRGRGLHENKQQLLASQKQIQPPASKSNQENKKAHAALIKLHLKSTGGRVTILEEVDPTISQDALKEKTKTLLAIKPNSVQTYSIHHEGKEIGGNTSISAAGIKNGSVIMWTLARLAENPH